MITFYHRMIAFFTIFLTINQSYQCLINFKMKKLSIKYNSEKIKLGDIVLIENYDNRYQHGYLQNSCSIVLIGKIDSPRSGYSPGLNLLMTDTYKEIQTKLYAEVKIKKYLNLKEQLHD